MTKAVWLALALSLMGTAVWAAAAGRPSGGATMLLGAQSGGGGGGGGGVRLLSNTGSAILINTANNLLVQ